MPSAALSPVLNDSGSAALAFDLAVGLSSPKDICQRHAVTQQHVAKLLRNPGFRGMITEYKQGWEAPDNAAARVQMKARMAQEDGLLHLFGILASAEASDSDRVAAFREIRNSSDAQPDKPMPGAAAGVAHNNIVINMKFTGESRRSDTLTIEQMPELPTDMQET